MLCCLRNDHLHLNTCMVTAQLQRALFRVCGKVCYLGSDAASSDSTSTGALCCCWHTSSSSCMSFCDWKWDAMMCTKLPISEWICRPWRPISTGTFCSSCDMVVQASQEEQPVQSDVIQVNRMEWPPLLINPSAPLLPFQQVYDSRKPLNKPDPPTGDISVPSKPAWDSLHWMISPWGAQRLSINVASRSDGPSNCKQQCNLLCMWSWTFSSRRVNEPVQNTCMNM